MAISDNYVPTKDQGDGVTIDYTANWPVFNANFLQVIFEDTTTGVQTPQESGFSVSFTSAQVTATFDVAPPDTVLVILARQIPLVQQVPYSTSRGFQGKAQETSYDLLTAMIQDQQDSVERAIVVPIGTVLASNTVIPESEKILGWNLAADAIINYDQEDFIGPPGPQGPPGSGVGTTAIDAFVDGVDYISGTTDQLTLSVTPGSKNNTDVYFDMGYQQKTWTLVGNVITFEAPIPDGVKRVEVVILNDVDVGTPSDGTVTTPKLADDAVTTPKLANGSVTAPKIDSGAATIGQVLTADGAGGADYEDAASGGLVFLGSFSWSSADTPEIGDGLDLDAVIDTTYDHYVLEFVDVESGASNITMRYSTDTGVSFDSGASDYSYSNGHIEENSALNDQGSNGDSLIRMSQGFNTGSGATGGWNAVMHIFNPNDASKYTHCYWDSGFIGTTNNNIRGFGSGSRKTSSAIDAIQISAEGGNIGAGTLRLWGMSTS